MRWKKALVLMRKDIDEFKKQKFLIGSIYAMPIVLGVIIPVAVLTPLSFAFDEIDDEWDIDRYIEVNPNEKIIMIPYVNRTLENVTEHNKVIWNARLIGAKLENVILGSCYIANSTIYNSTISECRLMNSTIENVIIINSSGEDLEGENVLAISSTLEFKNRIKLDFKDIFSMILNFILIIFIILPAALPTLIASYSLVGEKNNKSLEPLLATPTTDAEILGGKILSAFVPTMGATSLAFIISVILIDIIFTPVLGYIPLPNATWIIAILLLAPAACFMSILACVLISSKVKDVRAAQQLGGFVVMPVVVVMIGVMAGFLLLSPLMVVLIAIFFVVLDMALFYFAKGIFNREDILVKWV
ncbi:ABC transporter permease subunit [[Eubacterium] cellulosolvens]